MSERERVRGASTFSGNDLLLTGRYVPVGAELISITFVRLHLATTLMSLVSLGD